MKRMKFIGLLAGFLVAFCVLAAGCSGRVSVEFMDGDSVLKTVKVTGGRTVENWTPEKEGYEFVGWYATPALKKPFDFDKKITENTKVFSSWKSKKFESDTRKWMIAGESSLKSAPLNANNWGRVEGEARTPYLLAQKAGTNEFSITLDLYKGDKFQIADVDDKNNFSWTNQRGYGYLKGEFENYIKDAGNAFTDDLTKSNIEIIREGNYTLTLVTELSNTALDEIRVVRNGDPTVELVKTYALSISGSVTGGNPIKDKADFGDCGLPAVEGEALTFRGTISLNKGDFFSVLLYENSWDNVLRTDSVADSDGLYNKADASNITMTQSGKYRITVKLTEGEDKVVGRVKLERIGDFERTAGDNEVSFTFPDNSKVTSYVREGARVPNPGTPAQPDGKIFVGWYSDLNGNVPMSFAGALNEKGKTFACVPKFMGAQERDTRDVYIKGDFTGWAGNKPEYKMSGDGKHTYTFELTITEEMKKGSFMFTFYEGAADTGATANGAWADYSASTDKASGANNIEISAPGTYVVTMDTYNKRVVVTEKA